MRKERIILITIFLFGFLVRIWLVGRYPPLLWDEAALGYNAYSILKTGRDEYGQLLPFIFKSFGDYKPGLYVYLTLPFVVLLGLNELAIRLPSVILGSLTSVFLYLLVKEIFEDTKIAFWSALTLTFLPWSIHFSRGAWEANVMTALLTLGSYLLVRSRKLKFKLEEVKVKNLSNKFLFLSLGCFFLALLTYQGAKMLVPLILIGLFLFFKQFNFQFLISASASERISIILLGILIVAWYLFSFSGPAKNRLKVMSLLSYRRPESEIKTILDEDRLSEKNWHFYLFHHEGLYFLRGFLTRYFNHLSPRFLAFDGDWNNPRHSAPYFGMVGHVNLILLLIGLARFLSQRHKFSEYFFLYWLVIAPLPAALSRDIVSGVRSLPMVIPLSFFIGYGIERILKLKLEFKFKEVRSKKLKLRLLILKYAQFIVRYSKYTILIFLILDFIYWADLYFVHMVKRKPKDWLYGYKDAIKFVQEYKSRTDKVVFTDFYGQPYIYYLFYSQYSPQEYQRQARLIENQFGDVGRVEKINNIFFGPVDRAKAESCRHCLVIFSQDEILRSGIDKDPQFFAQLKPLGEINNNQVMFYGLKILD